MPTGHFVADRDLPLGGNINLDHLLDAAGQLIAPLERVELALLLVEEKLNPLMVAVVNIRAMLLPFGRANIQVVELEGRRLLNRSLIVLFGAKNLARNVVSDFLLVQDFAELNDQGFE